MVNNHQLPYVVIKVSSKKRLQKYLHVVIVSIMCQYFDGVGWGAKSTPCPGKKEVTAFFCIHSFVIFGMSHPED